MKGIAGPRRAAPGALACLLLLAAVAAPLRAEDTSSIRSYLVLFTREAGDPSEGRFLSSFDARLRELGLQPTLYAESLDVLRFPAHSSVASLRTYLQDRYGALRLDAVLVAGTGALSLLRGPEGRFRSDAPMILIDMSTVGYESFPDKTGLYASIAEGATEGTLRLLLRTTGAPVVTVAVSIGNQPQATVRARYEGVRQRLLAGGERDFQFDFRFNLGLEGLMELADSMSADGAVFLVAGDTTDPEGRQVSVASLARLFCERSAAPCFAPFPAFLGNGVVGGFSPDYARYGAEAADLALEAARAPSGTAARPTAAELTHVDWRVLKRFGIDRDRLPPGTVIDHVPPSFWESNARALQIAGFALALLAAVSLTLLLMKRRQNRALQAMNAALETRVAERTQALESANVELRRTVEELEASNANLARTMREIETMQSRLLEAEREATLGRLSAQVAHELNTPLGALLSSGESLGLALDLGEGLPARLRRLSTDGLGLLDALLGKVDEIADSAALLDRERAAADAGLRKAIEAGLAGRGLPADSAAHLARSLSGAGLGPGDLAGLPEVDPDSLAGAVEVFELFQDVRRSLLVIREAGGEAAEAVSGLRRAAEGLA